MNAARRLSPGEHREDPVDRTAIMRSGTGGTVPSTAVTGYRYSLLGYTTVVEAATPPLAARHTLAELRDTPLIDAAFLVLMGNNRVLMDLMRREPQVDTARVRDAVAWWLEATGGYGVKIVNPGGVDRWKHAGGNVATLDDEVDGPHVTPRRILETLATAVQDLGLPHPVHVHCNDLDRGQLAHDARHAAHARGPPRTSRTCSSTPTGGAGAGARAPRRPSWPSTSAPTRSSARTSAR